MCVVLLLCLRLAHAHALCHRHTHTLTGNGRCVQRVQSGEDQSERAQAEPYYGCGQAVHLQQTRERVARQFQRRTGQWVGGQFHAQYCQLHLCVHRQSRRRGQREAADQFGRELLAH